MLQRTLPAGFIAPCLPTKTDKLPSARTLINEHKLVKGAPEMSVAPPGGQDRIMIYGPKSDDTYIIEFRKADGESLAIGVPAGETRVLKHFQARMPYGLVVPDVP